MTQEQSRPDHPYETHRKIDFLPDSISLRQTQDSELVRRCIEYLRIIGEEHGQPHVIVPWLDHKGLNLDLRGYTVCSREEYNRIRMAIREGQISDDPLPAIVPYDAQLLEQKLKRITQNPTTSNLG